MQLGNSPRYTEARKLIPLPFYLRRAEMFTGGELPHNLVHFADNEMVTNSNYYVKYMYI